jgi:uncharacterized protein with HEPN domain
VTRDRLYLQHIAESISRIESYVSKGRDHFLGCRLVQDAVIRNFEIIGEATKRLSAEFQNSAPEIPWKQIGSFRDVLIHGYFGVDLNQVWGVVEKELPKLGVVVRNALK